jgi:Immunity protein 31
MTTWTPRFAFYEVVRVARPRPEKAEAAGMTGAVVARGDDPVERSYGVLLDELERVWAFDEDELESTGVIGRREDHHDDSVHLRVRVDAQGRGTLVDDED